MLLSLKLLQFLIYIRRSSKMALIVRNPSVDLPRLLTSSAKNTIQKVILDRCLITVEHAVLLREALLQTTCLKVLYLFGTTWASPEAFLEMTRGLAGNTSLKILYLCGDTHINMSVLGPALAANQSIQELHLWDNQLNDDDAVVLAATALSYCTKTRYHQHSSKSSPSGDSSSPRRTTTTTTTTTNNNPLRKLHVPRNNIGSRGANALIAAAAAHPTLQELHLSHNTMVHLCETSLPTSPCPATMSTPSLPRTDHQQQQYPHTQHYSLSELHLDGNPMLDIAQVARVLSHNPKLHHLNLGNCMVETASCLALALALKSNTNLTKLCIRKRNIYEPDQQHVVESAFCQVLQHHNRTLLELDLEHATIHHYLDFNKSGRHLLATKENSEALWPLVLQKVADRPALLYEFLSAKPEWCQRVPQPSV